MLKLILMIMFPLTVSFAGGYGLRDWVSRRRRKEMRKKFYGRHAKSQADAQAPKIDAMAAAIRRELAIGELHERLNRLEDRIADTTLEVAAFHEEARTEFAATRELLERKFEEIQHRNNDGRVLVRQTTGQRLP